MASRKSLLIAAAAMAVVVGALLPVTASATEYMVGDLDAWNLEVNYTDWVIRNQPFRVGDFFYFKYTQGSHNVVMLTSDNPGSVDSYTSCDVPITAQPLDSGDDIVQLPDVEKLYFFCGFMNHCESGMKFDINVYPPSDE